MTVLIRLFQKKFKTVDYEAARKTMEDDAAKRKQQIEILRDISRREYLKKREEDKLIELQQDIEDEKYLFAGTGQKLQQKVLDLCLIEHVILAENCSINKQ